jgi:hypothetical protein
LFENSSDSLLVLELKVLWASGLSHSEAARRRGYLLQQPRGCAGHDGHGAQHLPFGTLGAPNALSASIPTARSIIIFFIRLTSFPIKLLNQHCSIRSLDVSGVGRHAA